MDSIIERIEQNPVIAALRSSDNLDEAIKSDVSTIFLLHANIFSIKDTIDKIKAADKNVFVHMDFLEGIGRDKKAIEYISKELMPTGIISTKSTHIKYAKELGMFAIQRFFMVDSQSYETAIKTVHSVKPDMIEIMPGIITRVIKRINQKLNIPIIAGGLIDNKQDVIDILKNGALGVSTGSSALWDL